MDRLAGEALAVGLLSVERRLLFRRPAEDRHQLVVGRAILGSDRCARLAQPMRRALRQSGVVAPIPHLVAKGVDAKGLAVVRDHECHLGRRQLVEISLQHRNASQRRKLGS